MHVGPSQLENSGACYPLGLSSLFPPTCTNRYMWDHNFAAKKGNICLPNVVFVNNLCGYEINIVDFLHNEEPPAKTKSCKKRALFSFSVGELFFLSRQLGSLLATGFTLDQSNLKYVPKDFFRKSFGIYEKKFGKFFPFSILLWLVFVHEKIVKFCQLRRDLLSVS